MLKTEMISPRPRRTRHESAKHYDAERKDLGLTDVMGVLEAYADYGGGINCSVCGKLYKSKVCFIKHIWEHSIYWDLFAGDKNHMRVLSIQAALILYGSFSHPDLPVPVDNLLVTSPNTGEYQGRDPQNPAKDVTLPVKSGFTWNEDNSKGKICPSTPRKAKSTDSTVKANEKGVIFSSEVLSPHNTAVRKLPSTPVKKSTAEFGPPPRPMKKKKKRANCDSVRRATNTSSASVGDFYVASAGVTSEDLYWKEADACPCKRKRSE